MIPKTLTTADVNRTLADGIVTAHVLASEHALHLQAFADADPELFALVKALLLIDLGYSSTEAAINASIATTYSRTVSAKITEARNAARAMLDAASAAHRTSLGG